MHQELEIFVSRLAWLVEKQGCAKHVSLNLIGNFEDVQKVKDQMTEMLKNKNRASLVNFDAYDQ